MLALVLASPALSQDLPQRVEFAAGNVQLTGYLFSASGKAPAVVLMHGRQGAYSTEAKGRFEAATLSKRHLMWGRFFAENGISALLVDGFGPRGFPQGFGRNSYAERPDAVNEVTVRPKDALAALAFLKSRSDIDGGRVLLMGWSNGGSAALAAMAEPGFVGGIALYPGCGLKGAFAAGYRPTAPVRIFSGSADEEVSTKLCENFVSQARAKGGDIAIQVFDGAEHSYDSPTRSREKRVANIAARDASLRAVLAFAKERFSR